MGKRKNSTKAERTALLKKLGYTDADMQRFWDECISVNSKIKMLSNAGLNWTDLCIWQIEQLPTLKEKTLQQLAEKEEAQKKEEAQRQKEVNERAYYNQHFEEIMLQKIDNDDALTEKEIERLVFDYSIKTEYGSNRRWTRTAKSIIRIKDRTFAIEWEQGLTESQENEYLNQPYEVTGVTYHKIVKITEWVKKGCEYTANDSGSIEDIVDKTTEYIYCNYEECGVSEFTWDTLKKIREVVKRAIIEHFNRLGTIEV